MSRFTVAALVCALSLPGSSADAQSVMGSVFADMVLVMDHGVRPAVTARLHRHTGERDSYGIEAGYVNLGQPPTRYGTDLASPVWVASTIGDAHTESAMFVSVSAKMRGHGERQRAYVTYGIGVYGRSGFDVGGIRSRFGSGGHVGFGFEGTRGLSPGIELRVRVMSQENEAVTMVSSSVGINFNP